MNKVKRISAGLLIALAGALLAIFLYTKLVGIPEQQVIIKEATPVKLTNNAENASPQVVLPDLTKAAEMTVKAVVHIEVKIPEKTSPNQSDLFNWFFGQPFGQSPRQQKPQEPQYEMASGSGVILSPDGYIVTANHVVDNASHVRVILDDNRSFTAKVIGRDPNTDIALIKIDAKDLPYLKWGHSETLKLGQWVLAVGNPFNLTSTVTQGIVSAKGRSIGIVSGKMPIEAFIQTDAAVNPGNSGGALVDVNGDLVGIVTAIASETGSFSGYSFAVPATIARKVVDDIMKYGEVQRAVLGIVIRDVNDSIANAYNKGNTEGVFVQGVVEDGAAHKAGIKKGDIILAVNGVQVNSTGDLQEQIGKYSPGNEVTITYIRKGEKRDVKAVLENMKGTTSIIKEVSATLGAEFGSVSQKDMSRLGIDNGLQVTNLKAGKLKDAGVKVGFIITDINKVPISSTQDINRAFNTANARKPILIEGVYPSGEWDYYVLKPEISR